MIADHVPREVSQFREMPYGIRDDIRISVYPAASFSDPVGHGAG